MELCSNSGVEGKTVLLTLYVLFFFSGSKIKLCQFIYAENGNRRTELKFW